MKELVSESKKIELYIVAVQEAKQGQIGIVEREVIIFFKSSEGDRTLGTGFILKRVGKKE